MTDLASLLVEQHRRFLAFVERRVGSRGAAEDVLQSAFVRGLERVGTLRREESVSAWFYRVLRNAAADHNRRRSRDAAVAVPEGFEPEEPPPDAAATICACILGLSETLKPDYAAALRRVEVEGVSVQEFATEAGITPNNASVRLFRAREALRKRVNEACRICASHGCLDCSCARPAGQEEPTSPWSGARCKNRRPSPSAQTREVTHDRTSALPPGPDYCSRRADNGHGPRLRHEG